MAFNNDHLMSLPREVQAHILSFMFKKPSRSIMINLKSAQTLSTMLPDELLAAAKTCKSLAEATADVLGPHARVLNNNVWNGFMGTNSPNLHEWVAVLAPFVKAVSLFGFFAGDQREQENGIGGVFYMDQDFHDRICRNNIKVLNALSAKPVGLQVLDVKDLLHHRCRERDALLNSLVSALSRSAESLEQLGLRVSPICIEAIEKVCLPNLKVVDLEYNTRYQTIRDGEKERSEESLSEMVNALSRQTERAAKRSKKTTYIRELRLLNVFKVPRHLSVPEEKCTNLFNSVKILNWNCPWYNWKEDGGIGQFIGLFRNLESFHWRGTCPNSDSLRTIVGSCRKLESIHLKITLPCKAEEIEMQVLEGGRSPLGEAFRACHGKVRSLIAETLTSSQLTILAETNPDLEKLTMTFGRNNIGGLCFLLGNHCRKLQHLNMSNEPEKEEPLNEEGWRRFTEAVKTSSEDLCEISLRVDDAVHHEQTIYKTMIQSMKEITEFMGERAKKIDFAVTMYNSSLAFAAESLVTLMRTCADHATQLEVLHLRIVTDAQGELDDTEDERRAWEQLLLEKKRLMELPRLKEVNLGYLFDCAEVFAELDN